MTFCNGKPSFRKIRYFSNIVRWFICLFFYSLRVFGVRDFRRFPGIFVEKVLHQSVISTTGITRPSRIVFRTFKMSRIRSSKPLRRRLCKNVLVGRYRQSETPNIYVHYYLGFRSRTSEKLRFPIPARKSLNTIIAYYNHNVNWQRRRPRGVVKGGNTI